MEPRGLCFVQMPEECSGLVGQIEQHEGQPEEHDLATGDKSPNANFLDLGGKARIEPLAAE